MPPCLRRMLWLAFIVDESVGLRENTAVNENVLYQRLEPWELDGTLGVTKAQNGLQNIERRFQGEQVLYAQASAFDLDLVEGLAQVVEVAHGERDTRLQQADELFGLLQALEDEIFVGRKTHLVRFLQSHLANTMVGKHLSDALEAYFLFKVIWVNH